MTTKIRVRMMLDVTKEYTDEEIADLWPDAILGDTQEVVGAEERTSVRVDPVEYAAVLLSLGATAKLKVEVG